MFDFRLVGFRDDHRDDVEAAWFVFPVFVVQVPPGDFQKFALLGVIDLFLWILEPPVSECFDFDENDRLAFTHDQVELPHRRGKTPRERFQTFTSEVLLGEAFALETEIRTRVAHTDDLGGGGDFRVFGRRLGGGGYFGRLSFAASLPRPRASSAALRCAAETRRCLSLRALPTRSRR